ncbi:MAG: hypothetical protein PHR83_03510 [Paludibacter sp.]|nr:hypothetical protein [Paludibacter sp.]
MKKAMFILSTVLLFGLLSSCSTDELTVKKNWTFTVTTVTTYSPDITEAGPQTLVTTVDRDGLTELEAEAVAVSMRSSQTTTMQGITMTITVTVTKAERTTK